MSIFSGLFRRVKQAFSPYRIIHDPELGYCAQVWCEGGAEYCAIEADASLGVYHGDCHLFPDHWCATEAEAGRRINLHANSRGQTIVWRGE